MRTLPSGSIGIRANGPLAYFTLTDEHHENPSKDTLIQVCPSIGGGEPGSTDSLSSCHPASFSGSWPSFGALTQYYNRASGRDAFFSGVFITPFRQISHDVLKYAVVHCGVELGSSVFKEAGEYYLVDGLPVPVPTGKCGKRIGQPQI